MSEISRPHASALNAASPRRRVAPPLLSLLLLLAAWAVPPAGAAEYRDPEGRFVITLPDGYQEIDRSLLQARLAELRRSGVNMPAYQAAFDRGVEPRFTYPYALLEVVPVPGAAWTTADLEGTLGKLATEQGAREAAVAFDRLGLGNLMRDPRITFVRWEPERQAGAYRIKTQAGGTEVLGAGRIYFYRNGYITLWFYYVAGTPYADAAERVTAALAVLPAHRVPPAGFLARARTPLIAVAGLAVASLAGLAVWLARRRRPPAALAALLLALSLAGCASAPGPPRTMEPGSLHCTPSGYGTAASY